MGSIRIPARKAAGGHRARGGGAHAQVTGGNQAAALACSASRPTLAKKMAPATPATPGGRPVIPRRNWRRCHRPLALVEEAARSDRAGHREIARRKYETALYLLRDTDGGAAPTIIRRIARTYADDGQTDAALDCLEAALASARALDDTSGVAHALNLMALAHGQRGDLDRAEELARTALDMARRAGDAPLAAMIAQNLGIAASMRGDVHAALEHYARVLVTYRGAGLRSYLRPLLNNMALVYTQLDRLDAAQAAYDEAIIHCEAVGDVPHRLLALINSTDLWLARGDLARADELCQRVLRDATEAKDTRALAETWKHLGVIARMRGQLADAEAHLAAAYDSALQREDLLLAAEVAREQATVYESMNRNRETVAALSRSHRLFSKLHNKRDLADLHRRVGRRERQFFEIVTRWAKTIIKDAYASATASGWPITRARSRTTSASTTRCSGSGSARCRRQQGRHASNSEQILRSKSARSWSGTRRRRAISATSSFRGGHPADGARHHERWDRTGYRTGWPGSDRRERAHVHRRRVRCANADRPTAGVTYERWR